MRALESGGGDQQKPGLGGSPERTVDQQHGLHARLAYAAKEG